MENRSYALVTGLFILLLCAAVGVSGIWLSGSSEPTLPYVVVSQGSVSGLVNHSQVLYRGVKVGQVNSIRFDRHDIKRIDIHITIDADVPVTRDTFAVLKAQGVTGLSRLELNTGGERTKRVATGAANPATIPMHPSLLDKVTHSGSDILTGGSKLIRNINRLINADNRQQVSKTLHNLQQVTAQLVTLESGLSPALSKVPKLTEEIRDTLQHINQVLVKLGQLATSARQLGKAGQRAGQTLTRKTLPNLNELIVTLNHTANSIRDLTSKLNQHPESLLRGAPASPPGPGEPGYQGPTP